MVDLTRQKFGRLTVLKIADERKGGRKAWDCICECGNTTVVIGKNLKNGKTKSCGCIRKERAWRTTRECVDLTGQRFGKLTVIEKANRKISSDTLWKCVCDCGGESEVSGGNLKRGHTKSCGCIHRDRCHYDLTGQKFGKLTVIGKSDKKKYDNHTLWKCVCECGNEYDTEGAWLKGGKIKSCGCGCVRGIDLTGQQFGRLTAIEKTDKRKHGSVVWKCICECGNEHEVMSSNLVCGNTQSCGCLRNRGKRRQKKDRYYRILLGEKSHNLPS